jgi:ATP-binding cassette, subfamily B, bacterial
MVHPLRRLFHHARAYRRDIWLASAFSVVNKVFDVLPEVLIGVAVDVVVNRKASFLARAGVHDPEQQLVLLAALTVLVWVLESTFEYLHLVRWRNLAQNLQHDVRMEAYEHVQRLELSWFERRRTGNLMSILNDDVNQMERFLNGGANELIQIVTSSFLVGAVFFALTAKIAFLALIPVPAIVYGAFWFQKRLASRYAAVREAAGSLNSRLNNNLLGIATIKAFAAEDHESARIREGSNAYRSENARAIRFSSAITPVIRMAILAGFTVTLLYGGFLALRGEIGVGSYSVLVYLTQRLLWPMTRLADLSDLYQRSVASIERVMNLLETEVQIRYPGTALDTRNVRGALRFENVSFAYADEPTLRNVSFDVPAGTSAAFVGSTGGGKSTLVKLLLRFYDPQSGDILLDGVPIREIALKDLRRAIGYVAQDTFLSDASVLENIAYGVAGVPRDAILAAACTAEAHDFIEALPQGYETPVGERGQKLSGGQRQRIALARAILKDPRILVLDEATSSVDNETEAAIQRSLEKLVVGRTTLVIAHRLSTVRRVDRIHVIGEGSIVESGTHEALVAKGGIYAELWRLQTGEEYRKAGE